MKKSICVFVPLLFLVSPEIDAKRATGILFVSAVVAKYCVVSSTKDAPVITSRGASCVTTKLTQTCNDGTSSNMGSTRQCTGGFSGSAISRGGSIPSIPMSQLAEAKAQAETHAEAQAASKSDPSTSEAGSINVSYTVMSGNGFATNSIIDGGTIYALIEY